MIFGLVVAAGKQSRFKSDVPKALSVIGEDTLLDRNINILRANNIIPYIICSSCNYKYFSNYDNLCIIDSGYGSGDAVLKGLLDIKSRCDVTDSDRAVICWGDTILNDRIVKCALSHDDDFVIPCVYEEHPYVQIIQDGNNLKALFSKFGEDVDSGYHDLSIFNCNFNKLLNKLIEFQSAIYYNNKYNHKHGNEMEFLDVLNETDITGRIVEVDNYNDLSFNTIDELNKIIRRIKDEN